MKYRRLGKSGLQVSELSFAAWVTFAQQISEATAERLMTIAYDAGVNFFDNAEAYANGKAEIVMGKILKRRGWGRDTWEYTLEGQPPVTVKAGDVLHIPAGTIHSARH